MELDDTRVRWLLWVALALVGLGLWFFVLRGADQPDDPELGDPVAQTSLAVAPGDPARVPFGGFGEVAIAVEPGDGRGLLSWCLLAALDDEHRGRGMIGVTDLQGYDGLAFVYPEDSQNSYHMRGVPMPLSIAWLSADGAVVSTADMEPCLEDLELCPSYPAAGPYRMSIEVPQGHLDDLGIVPGAKVALAGSCAART